MRILFVDDDPGFLAATAELLRQDGHEVLTCTTEKEAIQVIDTRGEQFDVGVFDMLIGGSRDAGLRLIRESVTRNPQVPVIVVTGFANLEHAAESMEAGAFSYLPKERTELFAPTLTRARERRRARVMDVMVVRRGKLHRSLFQYWAMECSRAFGPTLSSHASTEDIEQLRRFLRELSDVLEAQGRLRDFSAAAHTTQCCDLRHFVRLLPSEWEVDYRPPDIMRRAIEPSHDTLPDPSPLIDYLRGTQPTGQDANLHSSVRVECELSGPEVILRILQRGVTITPEDVGTIRGLLDGEKEIRTSQKARLVSFALKLTELGGTVSVEAERRDALFTIRVPLA